MARLNFLPHLTSGYSAALEHQINTTHAGQAHWANTGPFGATCGECVFLGYDRQHRNKNGDTVKATHTGGCRKYFELTNRHGAVVPSHAAACRYFQRKENSNG
jgi:hypothetical protein